MESANLLPMLGEFDTRGRPCDVRYLGPRGAALETFLARDGAVCFVSGRCHGAAFGGNTLGRPSVPHTITVVP